MLNYRADVIFSKARADLEPHAACPDETEWMECPRMYKTFLIICDVPCLIRL